MRILYLSHYFPPEMGAPAARVYELSREWVRSGHEVQVLTGFPNHPDGVVPSEYRSRFWRGTARERVDGIDVVRTWLLPTPNGSPLQRIVNYSSFFASALLRGLFLRRPDVVVATSPQLLAGLAGWLLAVRFRRPFVLEVRDLWPESLKAAGVDEQEGLIYRALDRLASFLYRAADLIVPVSPRFVPSIASRNPDVQQLVVENGVDPDLFRPPPDARTAKAALGLDGKFVVSYVGTLGFAHGLDVVLEAAGRLQSRLPEARLLLVGDGAERARLRKLAKERRLENVLFTGKLPRAHIPAILGASDACMVLLRDSELFETVLPSKMLEYMACGRPVICGVRGLSASLVRRADAGIVIAPERADELSAAILRLSRDAGLCQHLGDNGRAFVLANFTRSAKARQYLQVLEYLSDGGPDRVALEAFPEPDDLLADGTSPSVPAVTSLSPIEKVAS